MKSALLRWSLAALVAAGIYGLFAWDHSAAKAGETGPVAKAQAAGWDALVGAGEAKPVVKWPGYVVKPSGDKGQKMAKSLIDSGAYSGGCDIVWRVANGDDQGGIQSLTVSGGADGVSANIEFIGAVAEGLQYSVSISVMGSPYYGTKTITVSNNDPSGETEVRIPFSWSVSNAELHMTHGTAPIGDKAATHAKEHTVAEEWRLAESVTLRITLDDMVYDGPGASGVAGMLLNFGGSFDPDAWSGLGKYAVSFENIQFSGENVDMSTFTPRIWYGSGDSALWAEGTADGTIGIWGGSNLANYPTWPGGFVNAPFSHDFSGCHAYFMDGRAYDPVVYAECIRRLNSEGYDIGPWKGRLSELRARGRIKQTTHFHTWDDRDPDVNGNVQMYLDRNQAEKDGIEVGFGRPDIKVEGAGWLAPRVNGLYNPETPSPVDGDYWQDGEYNGEPIYRNANGFAVWCKDSVNSVWAIGYGPGTATAYEQDGGGPQGAYLYGDLPNLVWNPDSGEWDDITEPPPIGYTSLDPLPAVSDNNSGTLASAGVPSFSHDLTWVFDAHTLAATSRTESPYVTNILSLAHDDGKGIFADAHDLTDFVPHGTGTTAPDVNGRFTLATPGDYLRLDLKQNFTGRQALVGALNAIPVPDAYRVRRHDGKLGSGDPAETAEAVYCWLGWGYLHIPVLLDDTEINVTTRLFYYDDVGGAGDNHKSDGTRQTEYTYSAGTLHTLTRNTLVRNATRHTFDGREWWSTTVVVDLHDAYSLAVVTAIEVEFDLGGVDYVIGEPFLAPDNGDPNETHTQIVTGLMGDNEFGQAQYGGGPDDIRKDGRAAPNSHGASYKAFENWRYSEGGFSAYYDGMYRRALWQLDNHKANAIERTVGYLNPVYGAKTGIDMTTCFSVAAIAGLITASTDAWTATHSPSAEAAAFVDAEDVALKTPACSDIVPTMAGSMGGIAIANRVYSITAVAGLPYTHYGTHYVLGRAHGMMVHPDTNVRRRAAGNVAMLRRDASLTDGAWGTADGGYRSDEHAHWESKALEIAKNEAQHKSKLYEYAAQDESMEAPVVMGPLATREWQAGDVTNKPYGDPNYCRDAAGYTHWRAVLDDGAVVVHYLDGYDKNAWRYAGLAWAQDEDSACPWVSSCDDGSLLCGVTNTLTMTTGIKRSRDGGATWGTAMANLGADLMYGKGLTFLSQTFLPGWYADKVWLAVSSRDDLAREMLDGTNLLLEVCAAPMVVGEQIPVSHVTLQDTGAIDVHVDDGGGGIRTYRCSNPLDGFTQVT
ncbi:MAG: hypothetical protein ACYC20_10135 [Sulfurovum sp.]